MSVNRIRAQLEQLRRQYAEHGKAGVDAPMTHPGRWCEMLELLLDEDQWPPSVPPMPEDYRRAAEEQLALLRTAIAEGAIGPQTCYRCHGYLLRFAFWLHEPQQQGPLDLHGASDLRQTLEIDRWRG